VRILAGLALVVLLASCSGAEPTELVRTTSFDLARTDGHYVTVAGRRIFALVEGSGPDVLLIHGNPSSIYTWRKVITPLARHYRVHAIDLPGYGFSDKPADETYTTESLAHYVVGYLDAAGVRRAAVVGSSMGGHVASEVAIRYPDRVGPLVLIDASGLPDGRTYPLSSRMLTWPVIGRALRLLPSRGRVADGLRNAFFDPSLVTEQDIDAYYLPLRSAGGTNAFVARIPQTVPEERVARIPTIHAPTLVITGDTDRLVPPAVAERYHELIGGSELLVMRQTGHLPHEERPDDTVAALTRWIDGHPVTL